jgi:hypothetical protein
MQSAAKREALLRGENAALREEVAALKAITANHQSSPNRRHQAQVEDSLRATSLELHHARQVWEAKERQYEVRIEQLTQALSDVESERAKASHAFEENIRLRQLAQARFDSRMAQRQKQHPVRELITQNGGGGDEQLQSLDLAEARVADAEQMLLEARNAFLEVMSTISPKDSELQRVVPELMSRCEKVHLRLADELQHTISLETDLRLGSDNIEV